ncbi:MAG: LamG domain-containing protein [Verrucomicrobia bacterium]|nr:LamG domain-containing protein [Verrucomicrobiota bacterium]
MKTITMLLAGAALAVLPPTASAQSWLTNGLVAYYPLDGNANDESGFARHGTAHGARLSTDRFGIPNRCYAFNGVSDYINASSTLNDVVNTFTMSMWFYAESANAAGSYLFTNMIIYPTHGQDTWGGGSVGAGISAGTDVIRVWEHSHDFAPVVIEYSGTFSGWTHVALVYSNRVPSLFVNGKLAAQGSRSSRDPVRPSNGQHLSPPPHNQRGGFGGGEQLGGGGYWFKGRIDEIRIYNRALTSDEVAHLYTYEGPCSPHKARATAQVVNGFVVGATITDAGCGYTEAPLVLIQGGGGSGGTATAVVSNGVVVAINITSAGSGYTSVPKIEIASPPFVPTLSIRVSRQRVTQNVVLGRKYILESSTDRITWTAVRQPFTATSETITEEFDVDDTGRFFQIRQVP